MTFNLKYEIAQRAAALIVDEGMEYGPAKKRALQDLGLSSRTELPDHQLMLSAVREHIAIFCPDSQAKTLKILREMALFWMKRLSAWRPHIVGAVWNGTATDFSDIHLYLYCDDPKLAQFQVLDMGSKFEESVNYDSLGQEVSCWELPLTHPELDCRVILRLTFFDWDELKSGVKKDNSQEAIRGDQQDLERRLQQSYTSVNTD